METSEDEFISDESRDANVEESSLETGKDLKLLYDDTPDRAPPAKTMYLLTPRENNSVSENASDQDQIMEMKSSIDMEEEMDDTMHDDLHIIEPFEENLADTLGPLNPIQETDNSIIIEEINANVMEETRQMEIICEQNTDDGFVIEKRISSLQESAQDNISEECYGEHVDIIDQEIVSCPPKKTVVNKTKNEIYKKIWDPKSSSRRRRRIQPPQKEDKKSKMRKATINVIDLAKLQKNIVEKQTRKVQTYENKGKANDNITIQPNQRLYQKIPPRKLQVKKDPPTKLSVFDFHDEEEEKRKLEMNEKMQKLEEIKERTCRICKEVFSDPLDVLRHKRKFHTIPKILLSKEELEPYLLLKNRNACPVCFKVISLSNVSRAHYINHVMIHCNKPSFKCKICGTTFKRKHALSVHENRHVVTLETAK